MIRVVVWCLDAPSVFNSGGYAMWNCVIACQSNLNTLDVPNQFKKAALDLAEAIVEFALAWRHLNTPSRQSFPGPTRDHGSHLITINFDWYIL